MPYSKPVTDLIRQRFSCRTYQDRPIEEESRQHLAAFASSRQRCPLGTAVRFELITATEEDRSALRGLGTYGFIRGAPSFILGAVSAGERNLEGWGYLMEEIILLATDLELGTCWLGGTFTRSSFARKIDLRDDEMLPAVASVGYIAARPRRLDRLIRWGAGADRRRPWEDLFFEGRFGRLLSKEAAGAYAVPLEMVRLGPSASNRQPWRIVRDGGDWHFYLQRTHGYHRAGALFTSAVDLQRVDMGIAMSHFALTASEVGLEGRWAIQEPGIAKLDAFTEYVVSWVGEE